MPEFNSNSRSKSRPKSKAKSRPEKCDPDKSPDSEVREYASSPCSMHELDSTYWQVGNTQTTDLEIDKKPKGANKKAD